MDQHYTEHWNMITLDLHPLGLAMPRNPPFPRDQTRREKHGKCHHTPLEAVVRIACCGSHFKRPARAGARAEAFLGRPWGERSRAGKGHIRDLHEDAQRQQAEVPLSGKEGPTSKQWQERGGGCLCCRVRRCSVLRGRHPTWINPRSNLRRGSCSIVHRRGEQQSTQSKQTEQQSVTQLSRPGSYFRHIF